MLANPAGASAPESRASSCRHPAGHVFSSRWRTGASLTLAELEALPCALLPVFLALPHARIAREKAVGPQPVAQIGIENRKSARQPHAHCARLTSDASAVDRRHNVKLIGGIGELQRLDGARQPCDIFEIRVHGPAIDFKFPAAGTNEHARHRGFAPAGAVSLGLQNALGWLYARTQLSSSKADRKQYLSNSSKGLNEFIKPAVAASGLRDAPIPCRPGRRAVFERGWREAGSWATSPELLRVASSRPGHHECALRELP